ncbi:hypothetical protein HC251_04245 [Iamia sp. SCSIO 61187]|uniref:SRPBCC family protein n=1 Tax=Iamia sp. SCSIO 61187 TaxID=2722752 RepID=UPI001C62F8D7|nr:SRPBCC family protein [Iamia sp. SCSIO 61187]QYG91724.1 hypothetical protein HC251_04245 [Iamia sp. SCSIO 61187]
MTPSNRPQSPASRNWPVATLSTVGRLRAVAAGLPGAVVSEATIDAPLASVWAFIADLESSVPRFDRTVSSLSVLERDDTRLVVRAQGPGLLARVPITFDVQLDEGWCWMLARPGLYLVAMAAMPDSDPARTRYAHLEAVAAPGRAWRPLLAATRQRTRRHVASDLAGIITAIANDDQ